ncbi:MAG: DUF4097 family beta strand repeat-containing protein [Acetatifactor sp.]
MKRFMRNCAIGALIMMILGFALALAAGTIRGRAVISQVVEKVTGGRVHVNLENWGDFGITVGEKLNLVNYNIEDNISFNSAYEVRTGNVEKYELTGEIIGLYIEAGGCTLETAASEDGAFYVEAENIGKFQGYVENGVLCIRTTVSSGTWNELNGGKIKLYLPREYQLDKAEIELGAGTMQLNDMVAKEFVINAGAGQIVASGVKAGKMELAVGMGSVVVKGEISGNLKAECSMGSVEMVLEGSRKDFNYKLQCAMGSIELENDKYEGLSQTREIENGAAKKLEVDCSMGSVNIRFTK